MQFRIILTLLFSWLFGQATGLAQSFSGKMLTLPSGQDITVLPEQASLFTLDLPNMYTYLSGLEENESANLQLSWGATNWDLEVWPSDFRSPDYQLITSDGKQVEPTTNSPVILLLGKQVGEAKTEVALSLGPDFFYGQVGNTFIEPVQNFLPEAPVDGLVAYQLSEIEGEEDAICGIAEKVDDLKFEEDLLREKSQTTGDCYTAEIAIAADYLVFQSFENIYELENQFLAILNMVRLVYDDEFGDSFHFAVNGILVSTCPECDPWTDETEANTLLRSFRDWGNEGGFGFSYDLASFWTGRVLDGNLAGLGYYGSVCEKNRYNLMRKYTNKLGLLRTLHAHEIGHNFNARHDHADSTTIMAPAIINTNRWTEASVNKINDYVNLLVNNKDWCLGECVGPKVGFSVPSITTGCAPLSVQFADSSRGEVTEWIWSFEGGTPNESDLPNPLIEYTTPGKYGVQLTVRNPFGEEQIREDTLIIVRGAPEASFTFVVDGESQEIEFSNNTQNADSFQWFFGDGVQSTETNPTFQYTDFDDFLVTLIAQNDCGADTTERLVSLLAPPAPAFESSALQGCNPLTIQFSDASEGAIDTWKWTFEGGEPTSSEEQNPQVTYRDPGVYMVRLEVSNSSGSNVMESALQVEVLTGPEASFQIEGSLGDTLIQFVNESSSATSFEWDFGDGSSSEESDPKHLFEEDGVYQVQMIAINECSRDTVMQSVEILRAPVALLEMDPPVGCAPLEVKFRDLSTGSIEKREWFFPGGIPESSTKARPKVRYEQEGSYSVRLLVRNGAGESEVNISEAIVVKETVEADFEPELLTEEFRVRFENQSLAATNYEWDFGDGWSSTEKDPLHVYAAPGEYEITLIAVSDCGRDTVRKQLEVYGRPAAAFEIVSETGCLPRKVEFIDRSQGKITEREWFFEGGEPATSKGEKPVVNYREPGKYDVRLVVRNAIGETILEQAEMVFVDEETLARFEYDYTLGDSVVQFKNLSKGAQSYLWDMGDGTQSEEAEPQHVYQEDGSYTVRLDAKGCGNSLMVGQVDIVTLPTAAFQSEVTDGCAPLQLTFENKSSENVQNYYWEFPGGNPSVSFEKSPKITYEKAGLYDVSLQVSNAAGEVVSEELDYIKVGEGPKVAYTYQQEGATVRFFNKSTGANRYVWRFGDGEGTTNPGPVHEYASEGNYTVSLIGTNTCGSDTTEQLITVIINDIGQLDWQKEVLLFPNPNNGTFNIKFLDSNGEKADLRVWNNLGQLVYFQEGISTAVQSHNVSLNQPAPGLYLVELRKNGEIGYWKVLIE